MSTTTDAYSYLIVVNNGFTITLTQTSTGKTKVFYLATGYLTSLQKHMDSLTDLQCSEWFKTKKGTE